MVLGVATRAPVRRLTLNRKTEEFQSRQQCLDEELFGGYQGLLKPGDKVEVLEKLLRIRQRDVPGDLQALVQRGLFDDINDSQVLREQEFRLEMTPGLPDVAPTGVSALDDAVAPIWTQDEVLKLKIGILEETLREVYASSLVKRLEAKVWIFTEDPAMRRQPFGFETICREVGLDPDRMRDTVEEELRWTARTGGKHRFANRPESDDSDLFGMGSLMALLGGGTSAGNGFVTAAAASTEGDWA